MTPTDAMVEAALDTWYDDNGHWRIPSASIKLTAEQEAHFQTTARKEMRAALTAALAVSGCAEVVEVLRILADPDPHPLPMVHAAQRRGRAILSRLTPDVARDIVSQGN